MTYAEFMMNTADGEPDKDNSGKKAEENDSEKSDKGGSDDKEAPIDPDTGYPDTEDERSYREHCKENGIPYP